MKLKNWDYKELAKRLELHRSTVYKWVFWERCPSKATRDRVLQVLQEEEANS